MAVVWRLSILLPALLLAGCFSTHPPTTHQTKPSAKHSAKKSHGPVVRYVRANDTLFSLGQAFGVDYRIIARRNHIPYPYRIYVGQRLYIDRMAPVEDDPAGRHLKRLAPEKRAVAKASKKPAKQAVKRAAPVTAHTKAMRAAPGQLLWPVAGGVITSRFGRRGSRPHQGVDIGIKAGTPVRAAASGEVVYSDSRLSGYGKMVLIRHGGNLFTAYAHNQRNLVQKGDRVKAGDIIARVGSTGRSTAPHLHFEVRQGSTPVDPLAYLPRR